MLKVDVDSTLASDWGRVVDAWSTGVHRGVTKGLDEAARQARTTHTYKDRTGTLTESIRGEVTYADKMRTEGVLEATAPYAGYVEEGTRPHEIEPRRAARLAWEEPQGDWHFAVHVNHPGTRARPFMGPAAQKVERVVEREVDIAVAESQARLER